MIDENLYWHMYAEYVYDSLVKYFGRLNHVKTIISKKIARQLYFAFIYSRIKYGIEVFEDCTNEYLQNLQVIKNKLLKLLLNFDRRMSTNELHQQLSLLKVVDIHIVNVLSHVPMAGTDTGQSSCIIKGARLWNNKFNPHLYR